MSQPWQQAPGCWPGAGGTTVIGGTNAIGGTNGGTYAIGGGADAEGLLFIPPLGDATLVKWYSNDVSRFVIKLSLRVNSRFVSQGSSLKVWQSLEHAVTSWVSYNDLLKA